MDLEGQWEAKLRWNTGYNADSVEWCPVETYHDVLVCGIYHLVQKDEEKDIKESRLGRIHLFQIDGNTEELIPMQTIESAGILDQKWCYHTIQGVPVLAAASSTGDVILFKLVNESGQLTLKLWLKECIGETNMALSLDWATNRTASNEPMLLVSSFLGEVHIWKVVGDELLKIGVWNGHQHQAWIGAFNYWDDNLFYSGGDDPKHTFKSFDRRSPEAVAVPKAHAAGVTAIRSHVDVEHRLITGSYDETVCIWDTRNLGAYVTRSHAKGGAWRLKWHPVDPTKLLVAGMYDGFRVLNIRNDDVTVFCEYLEHESIAYGADWKFGETTEPWTVATCSFYDCQMHVGAVRKLRSHEPR